MVLQILHMQRFAKTGLAMASTLGHQPGGGQIVLAERKSE
jgi:hypothetical protein